MSKYLNDTGLATLWAKIKALIPTEVSQLTNDRGFIDNEYMGYISNGYLYMPKGYYYYYGASLYTYPFPFIIQASDSIQLKSTTKLREIGKTTDLFSVGTINLDGVLVNSPVLSSDKIYIYRYNDGGSDIKTVCNISDLQNAISGKLDAPSTAGTAGQVLSTDGTNTIWVNLANSYDLNLGTAIPANANLNTYTTAGVYNADSTVISSITNAPTTTAVPYKLIVESIDDTVIRQIVITSSRIYQRTGDSSSSSWVFSDWVEYITSADFCTQAEVEQMLSANGFDAIVVEANEGVEEK